MDENIKDNYNSMKEKQTKIHTAKSRRKSPFVRILVMVVLLCVVVFGAVIVSDLVSKNSDGNKESQKADYVTIRVSGDTIYLDGEAVSLGELSAFFENKKAEGAIPETAFITDTLNPADEDVLSEVVSLLSQYDIDVKVDRIQTPASADEVSASTNDEIIR